MLVTHNENSITLVIYLENICENQRFNYLCIRKVDKTKSFLTK